MFSVALRKLWVMAWPRACELHYGLYLKALMRVDRQSVSFYSGGFRGDHALFTGLGGTSAGGE